MYVCMYVCNVCWHTYVGIKYIFMKPDMHEYVGMYILMYICMHVFM